MERKMAAKNEGERCFYFDPEGTPSIRVPVMARRIISDVAQFCSLTITAPGEFQYLTFETLVENTETWEERKHVVKVEAEKCVIPSTMLHYEGESYNDPYEVFVEEIFEDDMYKLRKTTATSDATRAA